MKDDCYVIKRHKGPPIEIMVRGGELWFNVKNLSPNQRAELLNSGEEIVFVPDCRNTYVRASYYARVWAEFQVLGNELARKLQVKLPWPDN